MLVAATSFAEGRDVTAKYLRNADMEQGMKYWSLEGEKVLSKNRKNPATQVGFHGMNQGVLEAWNSNFNMPLSNSTTMQRMHNLPNGTYVFGAYVGATDKGLMLILTGICIGAIATPSVACRSMPMSMQYPWLPTIPTGVA